MGADEAVRRMARGFERRLVGAKPQGMIDTAADNTARSRIDPSG
jgi:hypothetical protein